MQPYFIPYIGYWQLLNTVDKYVIYDDVNFIKGGWINRNKILVNNTPRYFNIPMIGASPNKLINEVKVNNDYRIINKNLRVIEAAYAKAPYFNTVFPIMEKILFCGKEDIASYIVCSLELICKYLGIETDLVLSSDLTKNNGLKGQEKVLEICQLLNATDYYNAIGGKELYSFEEFEKRNIKLHFLKRNEIKYQQYGDEFSPDLSIIDVMMFNSVGEIKELLGEYTLFNN